MTNRERYFSSTMTDDEIAAFVRRLRALEFSRYTPIPDCCDCPGQPECWWPRVCRSGLQAWLDMEARA
jgi:hypothetical protein